MLGCYLILFAAGKALMKQLKYSLCLMFLLCAPIIALASAKLATVQVKVTGIQGNQGVVRIAMFDTAQNFSEKSNSAPGAFQKGIASISNNSQAVYTFKNVPYGAYAIKLFHDEDNSGKLKKNFFGKPQEGFGFSNNPPIAHQAPSFEQAKFVVDQARVAITIEMINP
jgi:uncharacterized protein (DUF2141 family)